MKYFFIKEWVGDAYIESGVYESVDQFVKDAIKDIESDGSLKVTKKVISGSEIKFTTQAGRDKYTHKYIIIPINLNEIIK